MLGKNPHIARAEQAYDRAQKLITAMDAAFQCASGVCYDTRVTLYQFDLILQAILLNMALIDGSFHRLERKLIHRTAEYGDLMAYLRKTGMDVHWEGLSGLGEQERAELLGRLPQVLERTCNDFVRPLAQADGADPVDYLAQLEGELSVIAECLALVDGRKLSEEQSAYVHMLKHLLTQRWKAIMADV